MILTIIAASILAMNILNKNIKTHALVFFLGLIFNSSIIFAQVNFDSLKIAAKKFSNDTNGIEAMLEIATNYNTIDYELMLEFARRADSCIKNIIPQHVGNEPYNRTLNNQQARAYNLIAFSQHGLGNLAVAKQF